MPKTPVEYEGHSDWQWLNGQLAGDIIQREIHEVANLLPEKYYAVGLQLGIPAEQSYLRQLNGNFRIHLDSFTSTCNVSNDKNIDYCVCSDVCQLPFSRHSADLIIMPHTLDLSSSPTHVLREVSQVIDEDGTLVLTGFNPASLLGMSKLVSKKLKRRKNVPTSYSPGRIKEWLQLIGFEVFASCYIDYLPPINHPRVRRALGFLDKAGERWWPVFAGVYIILAKKKNWKPERLSMLDSIKNRLNPKFPQPVARYRD